MLITSSTLWPTVKKTIDKFSPDIPKKDQCCYGKAVKVKNMRDGYTEEREMAGLGLFEVKGEGGQMGTDTIKMGGKARYTPLVLAKKVAITHEAMRDNKYPEVLKISKRLFASAYKTQDIDAASLFLLASTSTAVGGYDSVCLASTAHVLPGGAHACNYLGSDVDGTAVGMTPSIAAFQAARTMATRMPGPSGLIESRMLKSVVFPDGMLDLMQVLTGTAKDPESNGNALNTVQKYGLKLYPVKHIDAVDPDLWGFQTDAEDGLRIMKREEIQSHTWIANDEMTAFHGMHYAQTQGWSDWRCWIHGWG